MNNVHIVVAALRAGLMALVSPLLEKNPAKTVGIETPFVFSMSRVIVAAFASAMIHQIWLAGIAGWPEATLSIAIVLAIPIMNALDRVSAADVVTLATTLVGKFGEGALRTVGSVYPTEPSKYDDHRNDATQAQRDAA